MALDRGPTGGHRLKAAIALLLLTVAAMWAQEAPAVREISPGIFEVGKVRIDQAQRTITFPAQVNKLADLIEYALVTRTGKAHESLLVTAIEPRDLQVATLLLGLTPTPGLAPAPEKLDAAYLKNVPELTGMPVTIAVGWKSEAGPRTASLESLILNRQTHAAAAAGPWLYTGSLMAHGKFRAQVDGSMIAVVTDPGAMFNNPRGGDRDDGIWSPNLAALPPVGTDVDITLFVPENPGP